MAFSFTTDIFNYMDTVTKEFVASNLGVVISTISPVIGLALICKLTLDGLFTLARPHGEPLSSLIKKIHCVVDDNQLCQRGRAVSNPTG